MSPFDDNLSQLVGCLRLNEGEQDENDKDDDDDADDNYERRRTRFEER